jgi:hypothetical protein
MCLESALEPGIFYFFNIIDFLQPFSKAKKLEHKIKGAGASVKPPSEYAERFCKIVVENYI